MLDTPLSSHPHQQVAFNLRHQQKRRVQSQQQIRSLVRSLGCTAHLYHEGDEAENLYEVTDGIFRLTRFRENGQRQITAFCYPGDIVGFPRNGLHCTDCVAVVPSQVAVYSSATLENGYSQPGLHRRLLNAALQEISNMQDHFLTLGLKSAPEKLASFLLFSADRIGSQVGANVQFDLPMPRTDIADYLGLTPETVSRTFTQLRQKKLIMLDHIYTVVVLDRSRLQELALPDN